MYIKEVVVDVEKIILCNLGENMKKIFLKGLTTGLILQLAIGPVFIFIANIAFQKGIANALFAVSAVTLVDYIYITMAIIGLGKLLEQEKTKKMFTLISSTILIIFGLLMIKNGFNFSINTNQNELVTNSFKESFFSAFILTISSPLTILFWTSIFTAKTIEYSMTKKELTIFGFASGFATFLFLGSIVILLSFMRTMIPIKLIQVLNIFIGFLLITYGLIRGMKIISNKKG